MKFHFNLVRKRSTCRTCMQFLQKRERLESCRCRNVSSNEERIPFAGLYIYVYKETKLRRSSGIASIVYQAKINFIRTRVSRIWSASLLRGSLANLRYREINLLGCGSQLRPLYHRSCGTIGKDRELQGDESDSHTGAISTRL